MTSRKWLFSVASVAMLLWQGCSSQNAADSGGKICTPGAYVFCRCADRSEGTKLCNADGAGFETCASNASGECFGGEIEDPDTGKPVTSTDPLNEKESVPPATVDEVEACPGKSLGLTPGVETSITGDTSTAKDDYKGKTGACAVGAGGKDHVYHVIPKGSGNLSIKVQGEGALDPTVYIRTTCDDESTQSSCAETTGAAGLEQFQTNVVTGKDYYLVIDGASGTTGKYTLTMKLTTQAFCGDGKVDANEACDDGNHVANDGCSADCLKIEGDSLAGNGCATGHAVDVWPGKTVTGTGSNNGFGNVWTNTGTSCVVSSNNLNSAPEHIYKVTAHAAGTLRVVATPETAFNLELEARTNCTDPATQLAGMCANDGVAGVAETMQFAVTTGQVVYVAVDGTGNTHGTYVIEFKIQ